MRADEHQDLTQLRYVLYARKSTEDSNRQVRSIDDQIKDCQRLKDNLGLNVVDIVRETKSAKKPHQRSLFDQMLKDIRHKKYDAILCWHPDRLSRNMLESGTIIDMLDEHVLKDIRFHSHQFSNDPNGKMLLGMLFVFSKQYSDDLSAKVMRGVKGNLDEGKSSGTPKFGYNRNESNGMYEPNENFNLIKEAWEMRSRGDSLKEITEHLNSSGYGRATKTKQTSQRLIKASVSGISRMFTDPFYYGVLVQTMQTVDLRTIYDFEPVVDEDTFNAIQAMSAGKSKHTSTKSRAPFYPFRDMVYCAACNDTKPMRVGRNLTGSKKNHVLTYRCDNKACTRKPSSLRAKVILEPIPNLPQ